MNIIVKGADFSALGLGNVYAYQNYVKAGGITNIAYINALKTLETSLKNEGLWDKLSNIYLFCGGSALADSINFKNASAEKGLFYNDTGAHTSTGFLAGTNSAYFNFNQNIANSELVRHYHAYNSTARTGRGIIIGSPANGGSNFQTVNLTRSRNSNATNYADTIVMMQWNNQSGITSQAVNAGTGLRSMHQNMSGIVGYDKGVQVQSAAYTPTLVAQTQLLEVGRCLDYGTSNYVYSPFTIPFIACGAGAWTADNEAALNSIVSAFVSSLV